jgi:hypothetical protein
VTYGPENWTPSLRLIQVDGTTIKRVPAIGLWDGIFDSFASTCPNNI